MNKSTIWLRISYWVGAIADGIVAGIMFAQAILARPSPLTHYLPEVPYRYAMGLAGSLMLGWTILLLGRSRACGAPRRLDDYELRHPRFDGQRSICSIG